MSHLGYSEENLKSREGYWTAREIEQQPASWRRTMQSLINNRQAIEAFITKSLSDSRRRIILTGAGTSAFAGECIAPILTGFLGRPVEAIASTDLVAGPAQHFCRDIPTLLVSFARSGKSPESVAAVELAEAHVTDVYQIVLSCNDEGDLYRICSNRRNALTLLMPTESNDRAFAMTSSFSCMLLAATAVFTGLDTVNARLEAIARSAEAIYRDRNDEIRKLVNARFDRVVYLGSNGLKGLAREASLKLLELTDGAILTTFESPLGVRHGPKSVLNKDTLVVVLTSSDEYQRRYDIDIIEEIVSDGVVKEVVVLSPKSTDLKSHVKIVETGPVDPHCDTELMFPYIVFAQIFGFHAAMALGNRPDNPSASGAVNRVVQGVTIHACTA